MTPSWQEKESLKTVNSLINLSFENEEIDADEFQSIWRMRKKFLKTEEFLNIKWEVYEMFKKQLEQQISGSILPSKYHLIKGTIPQEYNQPKVSHIIHTSLHIVNLICF